MRETTLPKITTKTPILETHLTVKHNENVLVPYVADSLSLFSLCVYV